MSHCVSCGACCTAFRVSFYWGETDAHPLGTIPSELTTAVSPYYVCMKGTEKKPMRCVALSGEIGQQVGCTIYEQRSSTCREFEEGSERCNQARSIYGLPAIPALDASEV
ncbi:MAG TPA: YkgJ family cysteine cluster protein [Methylophilus sp.]